MAKQFPLARETKVQLIEVWAQLFKARLSQSWISENFNCCLFTAKAGFSQGYGLRKRNLKFITILGHNFVASYPPLAVNKL